MINPIVSQHRPARVLLVEDNYGDVLLTKHAFAEAKIANEVTVASSGEEALAILTSANDSHQSPLGKVLPDLILLDLNLPMMSGQEVLNSIKSDDKLKHIPVIILSSSQAETDIMKSYNLHANSYVVKPVNMESLADVVAKLEQFWFSLVVLP